MKNLDDYFTHLEVFIHKALFDNIENLWDPLKALPGYLEEKLLNLPEGTRRIDTLQGLGVTGPDAKEPGIFVRNWMKMESPTFFKKQGIFLEAGTTLEPSAIIKGPCYVGEGCEIRQGAYLRGNVILGDQCLIGHNTEVKGSIIMDHTEAGHFNYIGDSILGSHVNLGAGARLANLQFRTAEEKIKSAFPKIRVYVENEEVDSTLEKLGAVLGDYVEVGCNAVLCPGTFVGKDTWIYPNLTLQKGCYPPKKLIAFPDRKIKSYDR